jgi:hypothetical protein
MAVAAVAAVPVAPVVPLKGAAVAVGVAVTPLEQVVQTQQTAPAVQAPLVSTLPAFQDRQEMEEAEEGDPVPEPQVETAEQEEVGIHLGRVGNPEITSETEVEAPALAQVLDSPRVFMVAEVPDLPGE